MNKHISITAVASISPLGDNEATVWERYLEDSHSIVQSKNIYTSPLSFHAKKKIEQLRNKDIKYKGLDKSVLYAIYTSRSAIVKAGWAANENIGVNIGSSRGATHLFEMYHEDFLTNKKAKTLSSPTTTLGNISSWVSHDLQTNGPVISHSITCSTALHAVLNAIAWIKSGMSKKFLVGGSEAPLSPFTIAQMQALKIYATPNVSANTSNIKNTKNTNSKEFPCQALDLNKKKNTMVLGEGAASICLELGTPSNTLAFIKGIGYATEVLQHHVSLSSSALCFQRSMAMALGSLPKESIDIIITHTPGTVKGDVSEIEAIKSVFNNKIPCLTNNKWKLGHTLGASGMLSIEMALFMLKYQQFIPVPYLEQKTPPQIKTIMINAVGFGGNAVTIILERPNC